MPYATKFSRLGGKASGWAGILVALSTGSALAGTVTVTNYTTGPTDSSIVQNFSSDNPAVATQIDVTTTALGTLNTYCTDLFDYIYQNTTYNYTSEQLTAGQTYVTGANDVFGGKWSQTQVNAIQALLLNGSIASSNINTAGIQVAIWEVEYGTLTNNAYNVLGNFGSGSVGTTDATLQAAQTYLNDVTSGAWSSFTGSYTVQYLTNPSAYTQPLLYLAGPGGTQGSPTAAPEPATLGLLGMGLVGLAYARRRKLI